MDEPTRQEMAGLIEGLGPERRARIAALTETGLYELHWSLGLGIRNAIRLGKLSLLHAWARTANTNPFGKSLDDLSHMIIVEVWKTIRDQDDPGA